MRRRRPWKPESEVSLSGLLWQVFWINFLEPSCPWLFLARMALTASAVAGAPWWVVLIASTAGGALGMLPIRQDLREQYPILFRLDWMQQLLDASYRQTYFGAGEMPQDLVDKGYGPLYVRLRDEVLRSIGRAGAPTLASVREAVKRASPQGQEVSNAR